MLLIFAIVLAADTFPLWMTRPPPAGHVHAEGFVAPPGDLMAGAGLPGRGRERGLGGQALPGHQHGRGAALPQGTQGSNRRRRIHGDPALQVSGFGGH